MIDTFYYLISARWFQLMVVGFIALSAVTIWQKWRTWREIRANNRLREDLQSIYALELDAIRQQNWGNTEVYELLENNPLNSRSFG